MKTLIMTLTTTVAMGAASVAGAPVTGDMTERVSGRPTWDLIKVIEYPQPAKPVPKKVYKPRRIVKPRQVGITVSSYAWCPDNVQRCVDAGKLTGYHGKYLAGHNYMGYQWLSRVAVGTVVRVSSGPLAGSYRVYGHLRLTRQGGSFPDTAAADLVMQSCEGSGTGFSLARRIK